MALSDQIKVPAQVKGAVGGGSSGSGAPAGTGFVRVTDGEYDTPAALSAADIPAVPVLRAKKTASQPCGSGAFTRLTFDSPARNDGAFTVGGTGNVAFTSTVAGWCQIDMTIYGVSGLTGLLLAYKDGAYETRGVFSADTSGIRLNTGMVVAVGTVVEIYLFASGGTITPNLGGEPQQYLQLAVLGRV